MLEALDRNERLVRLGIAYPHEEELLAFLPHLEQVQEVVLFGDARTIAQRLPEKMPPYRIVQADSPQDAAHKTCEAVLQGTLDCIMKGSLDTSVFLRAILQVLKPQRRLSHVTLFAPKTHHKAFLVSDCAMNIAPDAAVFEAILDNAIEAAHVLGIERPNVALLAAKEKVDAHMPVTKVYEHLLTHYRRNDCVIAGPFAMDLALSASKAKQKGIEHPVAGEADILIMPNIEAGNIFYKTMNYFVEGRCAGVILGACVPIVVTSRADEWHVRLDSIRLAMALGGQK